LGSLFREAYQVIKRQRVGIETPTAE